jgi:hypothetical protein
VSCVPALAVLLFRAAAAAAAAGRSVVVMCTRMHYQHSILALPVWRPRWRAARPLLWLSSLQYRCLLTAARIETRREGGTILISMLQQLPHHSRIICTRKYTTVARTCKPRLICLWPSAATITTMTTRRTPAASNVGQGCVTTGVCHGTRSDTIRSDQRDSALGEDLFPALLCYT